MTEQDHDRDQELDRLLEPMRVSRPDDLMLRRWESIPAPASQTRQRLPRVMEWAVAAAIGFAAASFLSRYAGNDASEHSQVFANVDATEFRLIAK